MKRVLNPLVISMIVAVWVQCSEADAGSLAGIHQGIIEDHPNVNHIGSSELVDHLDSENLAIFDVREEDEFSVSHLENAVRVDPDISRDEFLNVFGSNLEGKTVIFYCSVGRRSSLLAEKIGSDLEDKGVDKVLNLEQGIFGWHNRQLPLVSGSSSTPFVHPYSWLWKGYLEHKQLIRYQAE